jgi:hypothetical protein
LRVRPGHPGCGMSRTRGVRHAAKKVQGNFYPLVIEIEST